jgi:hypothetical protein
MFPLLNFLKNKDKISLLLYLNLSKRHILLHNEGIVDKQYLKNSNDSTYKAGQRIVISSKDVDILIEYLEKLTYSIDKSIENLLFIL